MYYQNLRENLLRVADGTRARDVSAGAGGSRAGHAGSRSVVYAPRKRRPDATQRRVATASVAAALSSTRQVASLQVNAC